VTRRTAALVAALVSGTVPATAEPPTASGNPVVAKTVPTRKTRAPRVAPKETAPADPAPKVALSVDAPTTRGTWSMHVSNDGDVPVRIVADARLLVLEIFPRGARDPVRCELPADMKPEDDLERPLVLPPQRTYTEAFEPRLYCAGTAKHLRALAPGAVVSAHLGWKGHPARFVEVSAIEGVEPRVASVPSLEAPPVALPDEPTPPPLSAPDVLSDPAHLSLRSAESIDAESVSRIEIPVTLRNDGARPVVVRFRPETLRFELVGRDRSEHCGWPALPGAPLRDQFVTLRPGGSSALRVVLGTYCSAHSVDEAGLYLVTAHLDTRNASGTSIGLHTFDGEVAATSPTAVRLRHGRAPKVPARPKLDPEK